MSYSGPIIDPHLHWFGLAARPNPNLGDLKDKPEGNWYPRHYLQDAEKCPLQIEGVVHIETIDEVDPIGETTFVNGLQPDLGIKQHVVCFVDLSLPSAAEQLAAQAALPNVVGVRHIINHEPSWPNVREDYLSNAVFRANYALLAQHKLSFDMQLNPHQMLAAAEFVASVPGVPVVIDHLGCLKLTGGDGDAASLAVWRAGLTALAAVPHVFMKLSMLPYTLAGWHENAEAAATVRGLVREVIALFGTSRCMFASNYPVDRLDGVSFGAMYEAFREWTADYSPEEQRALFHTTASGFYRLA